MGRRFAVQYFIVQAAAIATWWAALLLIPDAVPLFVPAGTSARALAAFLPGDAAVVIASAFIVSGQRRPWAVALAWAVAGAMVYATLLTIAGFFLGTSTSLGALSMVAAAIASITAATALTRSLPLDAVPPRAVP